MIWQTKRLGEVCEYVNRGVSPRYLEEGGIFVLNQKCIRDHKISYFEARRHDDVSKTFSNQRLIRVGDVLVNSTGVGTLGRIAQVKELKGSTIVDSHVTIVRPMSNIFESNYFGWAMIYVEELIAQMGSGSSGQTELSREILKSIPIIYPELISEQKRIVKILDEVFEKLAKAKENAEKNLQNSKELFESYLNTVFANPGKDWETKNLDDIAEVEYGYTDKAKTSGDFRFVRITDTDENGLLTTTDKMFVKNFKNSSKYNLIKGDLLMARTGASAGNVLFFDSNENAVFASYLIRIRTSKVIAGKLYWFFSKSRLYWDQVRQLSAGSAQPQFNGGAVKQVVISFPKSVAEQKAIVKKLDALSAETKKLEKIYEQKLADLEELKKSVLSKAFRGEL